MHHKNPPGGTACKKPCCPAGFLAEKKRRYIKSNASLTAKRRATMIPAMLTVA